MAPSSENNSSRRVIEIKVETGLVHGDLVVPPSPKALVIFAHGSGSSRLSPRNQFVASVLQKHGIATLLMDLLTADEEAADDLTAELRFDIPFLAARLQDVTKWVLRNPDLNQLPWGYFGASTGAAAALVAAASDAHIRAVVSRGGRPDLAMKELPRVKCPTLLIVGGDDSDVIILNQQAERALTAEKKLEIVPGATHLFEEPGTLGKVADLACAWFLKYLVKR